MLGQLLLAGGGGSFTPPPMNYVGLINAAINTSYNYVIGPISSTDGGVTWTAGSGSVIGTGTGWRSSYIKDPMLLWDGSQFVCYAAGYNGSNHQVGRFTASAYDGTWTEYGSNPIFGVPNDGGWRSNGAIFPYVVYDATATPKWKMWLTGSQGLGPTYTIGYLDSSDGLTWTDHGRVIDVGTSGDFDDTWTSQAAATLVGSTWYIYYAGYRSSTGFTKSGYATVPLGSEATAASYTKHGVLSGYSGNFSLGGKTWQSNGIRQVIARGTKYLVLASVWLPTSGGEEASFATTGTDPVTFAAPTGLAVTIDDGSWHANSAENPMAIAKP